MHIVADTEGQEKFAGLFWSSIGDARVFAFHGEMGAGKTTTITHLCKWKGVRSPMGSPTFSIINEYEALSDDGRSLTIFHIDLYRLGSDSEIMQTGVEDCINSGDLCFVEWPEKAPWLFNEDTVHVFIRVKNDGVRDIKIQKGVIPDSDSVGEQS